MVDMVAYREASHLDCQAIDFRCYSMPLRDAVLKDILRTKREPCQSGSFASVECAEKLLLRKSDRITDCALVRAWSAAPSIL